MSDPSPLDVVRQTTRQYVEPQSGTLVRGTRVHQVVVRPTPPRGSVQHVERAEPTAPLVCYDHVWRPWRGSRHGSDYRWQCGMGCGARHHCQVLRQSNSIVNLTQGAIAPHVRCAWQIIDSSVHNQSSLDFSIVGAVRARRCVVDSTSATLVQVDHNEHEWYLFCQFYILMPVIVTRVGVN